MLLAKVAGVLKALPTRAAGLFQAPLSQVARLAKALEDKTPAPRPRRAADGAPARRATSLPRHHRHRRAEARRGLAEDSTTEAPAEPAE